MDNPTLPPASIPSVSAEFAEPEEADVSWRDHSSAPRDGTVVLIASTGNIHVAYYETVWSWKKFRVERTFRALWSLREIKEGKFDVIGWYPLPEIIEAVVDQS